ncbi:membrane protein [Iodidimonas nitroreducens]|uniref:Membrane protein n=1 Tax=Iodidimonas nitroreducens TaxID=1236968 RepID=A0A5A7N7R9_9PROT|nr:DUF983 domain-containing protein [Iodidimonas nitroreducens]GER03804.1 membrane protein [Iodidimonas nitroreducens]
MNHEPLNSDQRFGEEANETGSSFLPVSLFKAGLFSRCPRCGNGALYSGFLNIKPSCSSCGLDFSGIDSGDGPAVFIILIVGFIVTFAALFVETQFQPPYWVHVVLWGPLILALSLGLLRPLKAMMVALQYRHKAGEGTSMDDDV